jgi:UDP-GlcNAc:undecaprenyl-phosphate/decaprenyl-phosphate GlcNAc-1-phosphate transferase
MEKMLSFFTPAKLLAYACIVTLLLPWVQTAAERSIALYWTYLFCCSFLFSFVVVPAAVFFGKKFSLTDAPDSERKYHAHTTPLTGGLAIYFAFVICIMINFQFSLQMKAILVGSTIIFFVGLLDDRFSLPAWVRLVAQIVAASLLIAFDVRISFIPDYLGGVYVETIITMIWLIGITNSMNFIDGMDGLAAGTSMIYSIFFAIIALVSHQFYLMFLSVALTGSSLGFFLYNFRPGKHALLFLGDSGATFLGFLLASFAIMGDWGASGMTDILVPVLIMSVLIFDMTLTTIIRIGTGEVKSVGQWLAYTGRDHVHHRLLTLGYSKTVAAIIFFAVSIAFGLEAVVMFLAPVRLSIIILLHSILAFIIIGFILAAKTNGKPKPGTG